jgi:hypothetical protein
MDAETGDQITLAAVQAALQRCLEENPPSGEERRLCRDASLLADVYGDMSYNNELMRPLAAISQKHREVLERWITTP